MNRPGEYRAGTEAGISVKVVYELADGSEVSSAAAAQDDGGVIGAELATVVIGGLVSSTFLTLIAVPVIYSISHVSIPNMPRRLAALVRRPYPAGTPAGEPADGGG